MKRLLAYLFIVLGLGLTLNVNVNSTESMIYSSEKNLKINEVKEIISTIENEISKLLAEIKKDKDKSKDCKDSRGHSEKCNNIGVLETSKIKKLVSEKEIYEKILKAKISKKEPSQKQEEILTEPITKIEFYTRNNNSTFSEAAIFKLKIFTKSDLENKLKELDNKAITRCKNFALNRGQDAMSCIVYRANVAWGVYSQYIDDLEGYTFSKILNRIWDSSEKKGVKTQIAKTEPSQTQPDSDLEEEKRKIAEERKKIEEEKRKIAEAKKKQEEEDKKRKEANAKLYVIGSGTGFFVSSEGHVVSNDHVVGICRKVATKIEGKIINFNVINRDEVNDLGLIKGDYKSKNFLSIKSGGAEFGEDIVAFGYPLSDALSTSVKLTRGIVSSLSGPGNNYSEIQIDAAIQPGNSGGPVLNMEGQVVGVASSGLNKLYMLESTEYIPENVNFAVAATTLSNFLKANGVTISNTSMDISNTKELAKIGRPATLQLFCMNTKAVYEELKKTKKHSDVLLEKVMELR